MTSTSEHGPTDPEVEALSIVLHAIYQQEARRQGDIRHEDDYFELSENTKEYDRVLARYILERESRETSVPPIDEETERFILRLRSALHDFRLAIENREGWTPSCQELWDLVRMDDHWTKDGWKERTS